MTLIRWTPLLSHPARDLMGIQDEVNRLFESAFSRSPQRGDAAPVFTPAVDIEESPEEFIVHVDLPGMSREDVRVSLMGDTLTLRGERKEERERKDRNFHRVERSIGVFERSFTFGAPVKNEGVKANYRDGVLEIHVPKAEEARMREIQVQVAS